MLKASGDASVSVAASGKSARMRAPLPHATTGRPADRYVSTLTGAPTHKVRVEMPTEPLRSNRASSRGPL